MLAFAGDQCVTDDVTGLMWEVKTLDGGLRDARNLYTNYSAAYNQGGNYRAATDASGFADAVNSAGLCGFNDWRLPGADELLSLADFGTISPAKAVDENWFPNTQNGQDTGGVSYTYWSATPSPEGTTYGRGVYFGTAGDGTISRDNSGYVRLVRGAIHHPSPRFSVSADGLEVTDNETQLVWRRCVEGASYDSIGNTCVVNSPGADLYTHEAALQRATTVAAPWRLPNVKELSSIVDRSVMPAIDSALFPATPTGAFWSSTPKPDASLISSAYVVDANFGTAYFSGRTGTAYVRLVRDAP